eukprot:2016890-Pyramimonas_sp.AAC.1
MAIVARALPSIGPLGPPHQPIPSHPIHGLAWIAYGGSPKLSPLSAVPLGMQTAPGENRDKPEGAFRDT